MPDKQTHHSIDRVGVRCCDGKFPRICLPTFFFLSPRRRVARLLFAPSEKADFSTFIRRTFPLRMLGIVRLNFFGELFKCLACLFPQIDRVFSVKMRTNKCPRTRTTEFTAHPQMALTGVVMAGELNMFSISRLSGPACQNLHSANSIFWHG